MGGWRNGVLVGKKFVLYFSFVGGWGMLKDLETVKIWVIDWNCYENFIGVHRCILNEHDYVITFESLLNLLKFINITQS